MITHMRTTVIVDDRIFKEAKKRAAARGITVSDLVNDALRQAFADKTPPVEPFRVTTFGSSEKHHVTPQQMADALDDDRSDLAP